MTILDWRDGNMIKGRDIEDAELWTTIIGDSPSKTYMTFREELEHLMRKHGVSYIQASWRLSFNASSQEKD